MPMISESTPVAFSDPLPDAVDVVVIGAGVIGTSTAWFLAQRGVKVALCEKGRVAGEQSSRNWGWVRQQGRDAAELPIMMESNRIWRGLAGETGEQDLAFTAAGCVYLARDERELAKFEAWHDLAKQHQLDTRMLSPAQARAAVPGLEGRWAGAMLTPSDGRAEPFVAVPALARAAHRLGVSIVENCAVRTLETAGGRVRGVRHGTRTGASGPCRACRRRVVDVLRGKRGARSAAARGPIHRGQDQRCGRPWASECRRAGICCSQARRRRLYRHHRRRGGALRVPALVQVLHEVPAADEALGKDLRIRMKPPADYPGAWGSQSRWSGDEVTPFERMRVLDPPPSEVVRRRLNERLPRMAPWLHEAGIAELWAGMIDVTPDAVPYVCEAPALRVCSSAPA